ncbi:MAG: hypothetical protein GTO45_02395 [Candidatus Aminicenantes bacterium]|nr:hypothetical protein [Candidatus Aminicenantes bacterium]NIM77572.1 hypothetical protein [Candidatus Aminicenantes bacterium]NIN16894.1 hypothetical protein [Candidatus Aminicenantes bacterium]NIN40782.1 hypothetical protein [Candidatus Aminicenantes bacterium]NIN83591.1 hypothetical protein [Candidatus Aminicenantes bacterium]
MSEKIKTVFRRGFPGKIYFIYRISKQSSVNYCLLHKSTIVDTFALLLCSGHWSPLWNPLMSNKIPDPIPKYFRNRVCCRVNFIEVCRNTIAAAEKEGALRCEGEGAGPVAIVWGQVLRCNIFRKLACSFFSLSREVIIFMG